MMRTLSGKVDDGGAEDVVSARSDTPLLMSRIPALDGIRTIAVLLVMGAHGGLGSLIPGGFGVTVFFFLSGFLITSLMRSENRQTGTVSLAQFYIRRFIRILPPLYISLALCEILIASGIFVLPRSPEWLGVVSQVFFFQNYASLFGNPIGIPLTGIWSLAVEEHFYMFFPLCYVFLVRKLSQKQQLLFCLLVCAIPLGFRIYYALTLADYSGNYNWSHTRIDSIMFGVSLALFNNPRLDRDAWRPHSTDAILAIAILFISLIVRDELFRQTLRYTLQGVALYILFSYAIWDSGRLARLLASPFSVIVARYSYTLYLIHLPLLLLLRQFIASRLLSVPVAYMLAFLYAAAMYRWVERPLAAWRHRLHSARTDEFEKPVHATDLIHDRSHAS